MPLTGLKETPYKRSSTVKSSVYRTVAATSTIRRFAASGPAEQMPRLDPVGSPAPRDAFARAPARRQAAPGVYSLRDHGDRRHARIQRDARAGGVAKEYLAVVRGLPL